MDATQMAQACNAVLQTALGPSGEMRERTGAQKHAFVAGVRALGEALSPGCGASVWLAARATELCGCRDCKRE